MRENSVPSSGMPLLLGFSTATVLGIFVVLWSMSASISGAIIAQGRFETEVTPHLISHESGGLVRTIYVRDGETIDAGDTLLELDGTAIDLKLESVNDQLTDLIARRARLEAEREGRESIGAVESRPELAASLKGLQESLERQQIVLGDNASRLDREIDLQHQRVKQTEGMISGIDAEIAAANAEMAIITDSLESQRRLHGQGWVKKDVVLKSERERLRKVADLARLQSQRDALVQSSHEHELMAMTVADRARQAAQKELDSIEPEILKLIGVRSDLNLRRKYLEVRAPVGGQLYDLKVLGGGYVLKPGGPIATIIPNDGKLQAVVRVGAHDIDQVFVGQDADVRLRAFSARSTPLLTAKVTQIAGDVVTDPATKSVFFETLVEIDEEVIADLPKLQLVNGMEVTAFIQTESETPFAYVTRPVREYFELALRDR